MSVALRQSTPHQSLAGFGRSRWVDCQVASVGSVSELSELMLRCRAERLPLTFRGSGRSYGDPSLLAGGLVIDLTHLTRVLSWDASTGIVETEPGVTIEQLWRHTLPDGYWPAVVPGTMRPTLGGCLAMNIHGKNNFRVGSIGEHVLDFDLLTPDGRNIRCSRSENGELFHAAISGLGLLGAIVRVRMQLKRVNSGLLRVRARTANTLDGLFDLFEQRVSGADYMVGWVDCLASGRSLGRGLTHDANYIGSHEDPLGTRSLQLSEQILPSTLFGVPKRVLPLFMRPFFNNPGVRAINAAKYYLARLTQSERPFYQSHVAFAFLLDYIPGWELAYGSGGLIQFQVFAPAAEARQVFREVLSESLAQHLPAYLGVMKRHRPDPFLLTHALDGYSLALDYRITRANRARLQALLAKLTDSVLAHGGKFYFAKDSVLNAQHTLRAYGPETLRRFFALKAQVDPDGLLESELSKRVFGAEPAQLTS